MIHVFSRVLARIGLACAWLLAAGFSVWAFGALYYDLPQMHRAAALWFAVLQLGILVGVHGSWKRLGVLVACSSLVLAWWLTITPSGNRPWQPDVAQTAWADVEGETVTIHNVRNCEYRTETDYTPRWEIRSVRLSQIRGIDLAINYWGSPWMAHPIAIFRFADTPPICFSIETRKQIGQGYSAIGGLYRQFELIYVVADERDVIRVRTNFRQGEDVYLYHTNATPEQARIRFLDYIAAANNLHEHPRWYNAVTTNCTTSIRTQHTVEDRPPWDWRLLVNGKGDEMLFENGTLASAGLPFPELKQRARINEDAIAADQATDFSTRIREGRPGFQ